jgi:endonuclease III
MKITTGSSILKLLRQEYGPRFWQPHHDPMSELVLTILSQNTSDKNSRAAFQELRKTFPDWDQLMEVETPVLADAIRKGGLANIKARRIQSALLEIQLKRGTLDLTFLTALQLEDARTWLLNLPGVGFKTAACVLLFSFGMPAMPVDTHVYRVATRLGLIPPKTTQENAHRQLEKAVPEKDIYEFHMLMIEHGRRICSARGTDCKSCICKNLCAGYDKYKIPNQG